MLACAEREPHWAVLRAGSCTLNLEDDTSKHVSYEFEVTR
jgi:hypothetical protein